MKVCSHNPQDPLTSPFYPERSGAGWWADWMVEVEAEHGVEVAFVPCFLDYRASIEDFAPISYGVSYWGQRSPAGSEGGTAFAADARERGLRWMQLVSVQDARPAQGVYDEANNSENLRLTWRQAIDDAQWVQLVTWNDYAEGTQFAPSVNSGRAAGSHGVLRAVVPARYRSADRPPHALRLEQPGSGRRRGAGIPDSPGRRRDQGRRGAHPGAPARGRIGDPAPLAPGAVGAEAVRDGVVVASVRSPVGDRGGAGGTGSRLPVHGGHGPEPVRVRPAHRARRGPRAAGPARPGPLLTSVGQRRAQSPSSAQPIRTVWSVSGATGGGPVVSSAPPSAVPTGTASTASGTASRDDSVRRAGRTGGDGVRGYRFMVTTVSRGYEATMRRR